jgi:hypothetical protein
MTKENIVIAMFCFLGVLLMNAICYSINGRLLYWVTDVVFLLLIASRLAAKKYSA